MAPAHIAALPPAITDPPDNATDGLRASEVSLLRRAAGREDRPLFTVVTATTVDTGSWLGKRRVVVATWKDRLAIAARGPEPLAVSVERADVTESTYNHVAGRVVLAPASELTVRELQLPPREAYQLLAQIQAVLDGPNPR